MFHCAAVILLSLASGGVETSRELEPCLEILDKLDGQTITVSYRDARLRDVVTDLNQRLPIPMRADWEALKGIGISADRLVTLRAEASTCSKVLASLSLVVADQFDRPLVEVFAGQIVLTSSAGSAAMRLTAAYDVRDLLADGHSIDRLREAADHSRPAEPPSAPGGETKTPDVEPARGPTPAEHANDPPDQENPKAAATQPDSNEPKDASAPVTAAERFVSLVMDHVDPEAWINLGGQRAQMSEREGVLIVSAPASVHRRMRDLLNQLRSANPTAVTVEAAIIDLPRDVLVRLSRLHDAGDAALAQAVRAASEAVVIWQTRGVVAIGQAMTVESKAAETAIRLSLKTDFDRRRGLLRFEIDAGTELGSDQRSLRTTAELRVGQAAGVFELPAAKAGSTESATTRLLVLLAHPTT